MKRRIINWVLHLLKKSFLAPKQFTSLFSFSLITFAIVVISVFAYKIFVSSAKSWTIQFLKTFYKSLVCNIELSGTPQRINFVSEKNPDINTYYIFDKNE